MDTVTQIALGSVAAHALAGRKLGRAALLIGGLAGLLPDLDVVIKFENDPLSGIIYHRHITHALIVAPLGAALASVPFLFWKRLSDKKAWVYAAAFIAYFTHAPLDWLTSYGTQILLPFTNARYSLDWVSIVDPIYTLTLILGILGACFGSASRRPRLSSVALNLSLAYLLFCGAQHFRALQASKALASSRGHTVERVRVMPTLGNNIIWRSVYRTQGVVHIDEIRVPWIGPTQYHPGSTAPLVSRDEFLKRIETQIKPEYRSWAIRNFDVWSWFSDGFVTELEGSGVMTLTDQRFSPLPEGTEPLWGITFDTEGRVERFGPSGPRDQTLQDLWERIKGTSPRVYQSL